MSPFRLAGWFVLLASAGCLPVPHRAPPPLYQPTAAESTTTRGIVISVERPRPEDSQSYVHIVLAPADEQPVRLALAPRWYLDRQGIRYDPRESLAVEGTRVVEDGQSTIVVRKVRQNERSYVLRTENDRPAWLAP